VGPTGAGKTTLVSLIPRFYDARDGAVLLDGVDIRKLTRASLRSQISIVLQEPLLFSGAIRDNIRYGRLEASDEEVYEAARAANAHDFVTRLPQQYETKLGEGGAKLSGGERQRIAVARAFLKDAPILILDEPTSSIDSKTEGVILDALDRLMEGRTTFLIAHRLSTIRHADLILVMNGGRLVEHGAHDELLARDGLYAQLHAAQTQVRHAPSRNGHKLELAGAGETAAASATRSLVDAVRMLLAAGTADLRVLAERESESHEIRGAAAMLAELSPEQLDALRDLGDARLAAVLAAASRPADPVQAVAR
jgi:ABC-type multidrug transport system ATPase subunit